jgi:glycosyltransferase involved in cell wall biosynthesis
MLNFINSIKLIFKMISVAIPTYNRPHKILNAVDSVLKQSYQEFEIIIHDNSEKDETELIVNTLGDNRINYQRHPKNIGIHGNWNSLLQAAKFNNVKFLNDDDFLKPNCLEDLSKIIMKHPNKGVYTVLGEYINEKGRVLQTDRLKFNSINYSVSKEHVADLWFRGNLVFRTPTHSMYNRQVALKLGGFNPKPYFVSDISLALRCALEAGAIAHQSEPLVSFVMHPENDGKRMTFLERYEDQIFLFNYINDNLALENKMSYIDLTSMIFWKEIMVFLKNRRFRETFLAFNSQKANISWSPQNIKLAFGLVFQSSSTKKEDLSKIIEF